MVSNLLSNWAPTPCASARELVSFFLCCGDHKKKLENVRFVFKERELRGRCGHQRQQCNRHRILGGIAAGVVRSAVIAGRLLGLRKVCTGDCVDCERSGRNFHGSFLPNCGITCW